MVFAHDGNDGHREAHRDTRDRETKEDLNSLQLILHPSSIAQPVFTSRFTDNKITTDFAALQILLFEVSPRHAAQCIQTPKLASLN